MSIEYNQIIKYYRGYVLLRCSEYTNSKINAKKMTASAFMAIRMLSEDKVPKDQLGHAIDCIIGTTMQQVTKEQSQAEEKQRLDKSDVPWVSERMYKLAMAVNMLDEFTRHVLVLHHMGMMSTKELSLIFNKSIPKIRFEINKGEKEILEHLAGLLENEPVPSIEDVCLWLDELHETLNLA
jgi:DNA-directed RNA polymerase specialized sigma24 family protein